MNRPLHALWAGLTSTAIAFTGCAPQQPFYFFEDGDLSHYVGMATNIEHPDVETASLVEVQDAPPPLTLENAEFEQTWDLRLEEAVRLALQNGKVMRSLGGRLTPNGPRPATQGQTDAQIAQTPNVLLSQPLAVPTVYDPAINETSPITGVEAALAEFDAQLESSVTVDYTDRPQNIRRTGALGQFFNTITQQRNASFNARLSKRTATGGTFGVQTETLFNRTNSVQRDVPETAQQTIELQAAQPLLRGGGLLFNRIAGPIDGSANFDGVVLARINTDIALADFEAGVRNLVSDVEQTYWELYFAYRNLESRKVGRDSALQTWRRIHALYVVSARGGEAEKEAQSREQYFFFRGQVEAALSDLYKIENRLRYLMGLGATDGRLIRPVDEPTTAHVVFDWYEIHAESMVRSVELRQQKWRIKQRELELIASKNLLLPRLDAVARYRFLGLGDDAFGTGGDFDRVGLQDTSAIDSLVSGDFQESSVGLQFSMPLGFRRELSTVRNQQLLLARERSRLEDQELELSHQLADAIRDLEANYAVTQTNLNRRVAADKQVEAVQAAYEAGTVTLDLLLDAQRRLADAESSYFRSLVDYNRGVTQVHFRKGSLLEYNGVLLAEGPWPGKAYFDAHRLARQRDAALFLDYGISRPEVISEGPFEQQPGHVHTEGLTPEQRGEVLPAPTPAQGEEPLPGEELPPPPETTTRTAPSRGAVTRPVRATRPVPAKSGTGESFDWQFSLDASGRQRGQ